jgi:two-component sensor histidine kinase
LGVAWGALHKQPIIRFIHKEVHDFYYLHHKKLFETNSGTLVHDPATGAACLRVRDGGVGLPTDPDWRQSASLGLRLVKMMAGQMRGTVQAGPGTEFQINFNVKGIPS